MAMRSPATRHWLWQRHAATDRLIASTIEEIRLTGLLDRPIARLSGGQLQRVLIDFSLLHEPELLILDEPSMGLAPLMVQQIFAALRQINQRGLTVLLVEQNVRQALRLVRRAYVLETGRVVLSGSAAELTADQRLEAAYLGGDLAEEGSPGA